MLHMALKISFISSELWLFYICFFVIHIYDQTGFIPVSRYNACYLVRVEDANTVHNGHLLLSEGGLWRKLFPSRCWCRSGGRQRCAGVLEQLQELMSHIDTTLASTRHFASSVTGKFWKYKERPL